MDSLAELSLPGHVDIPSKMCFLPSTGLFGKKSLPNIKEWLLLEMTQTPGAQGGNLIPLQSLDFFFISDYGKSYCVGREFTYLVLSNCSRVCALFRMILSWSRLKLINNTIGQKFIYKLLNHFVYTLFCLFCFFQILSARQLNYLGLCKMSSGRGLVIREICIYQYKENFWGDFFLCT